jgi:uncharacterized protein (TIGR03790 family)
MKSSILFFLLTINIVSFGQNVSYDDVAVIVNDNSQTSVDIGNYFQNARNIPSLNMIHVTAPTTEAIDSAEFELIRDQIESYLLNNNLADSINYLVTTKGVPLKIDASCFNSIPGPSSINCASFDSELCLILGADSTFIGMNGSQINPVYESTQHFSHVNTGVYLVTRLTGYTKQDVYDLIDRSGFEIGLNQGSAQAVLDLNSATGGDSAYFHDFLVEPANDFLIANSWNSVVDLNVDPLLNQANVFAYGYYGHGPISNVALNYNWTLGSIGLMVSSKTTETFDLSQNANGDFLLGDLIAGGCSAGMGYINPNFFGTLLKSDVFFDRYLDVVEDYNLAESFYMAEPRMSWQAVFVGDPKASGRVDNTAGIDEPEELALRMHPNPTQGMIRIESNELISNVQIYNMNGALLKSIDGVHSYQVDLDLYDLNGGVYLAHIFSEDKMKVERIVLAK